VAKSAVDVYQPIASANAKVCLKGDNSGMHKKKMDVWSNSGIAPSAPWYIMTKDSSAVTLKKANRGKGHDTTDNSIWVVEKGGAPNLKILLRGNKFLINTVAHQPKRHG
jgi:ABC-type tungstate transport system permease subunit